ELERVSIGGGDDDRAAARFLLGGGGGQEVVGLVPGLLRRREAERAHELREELELLEDLRIEDATALVGGERLEPVGRLADTVPADEDGARPLRLPQPQEEVRKADERARRKPGCAPQRLRQRVVGAVRERVAVDREQRL